MGNCLGRYEPPPAHIAAPRARTDTPAAIDAVAPVLTPPSAMRTVEAGSRHPAAAISAGNPNNPHQMHRQTRLALQAWDDHACGETDEAVQRLNDLMAQGGNTLNWSGLNLTSLPDCFGQLRFIEHLDIGDNTLTSLPASIGRLTNLTHLDVRKNSLNTLPACVMNLQRLQRLNLEGNQLEELPRDMQRLTALRELRLRDNRIIRADLHFSTMTALLELNLERNPIRMTHADLDRLGPTTLVHAQNAYLTPEDKALITGRLTDNRTLPCVYLSSELETLPCRDPADHTADPISGREPGRRIQLLLEAASHLTSRLDTEIQQVTLGNRRLTRKDCLLMALETALEHNHDLIPVISYRLIHDLPDDTARFEVFGSHLKRERITEWSNRTNLPVKTLVNDDATNVGNQMRTLGSQNVHADVVLIAGANLLERIRQRVPAPLSQAQTRADIAAHLRATRAPDAALRGLEQVMNSTGMLGNFNASGASAMALMWTYITQTEEQPLRQNLLDAMQNRLSDIHGNICATGIIQRVIDIPNQVDLSLTGAISMEQLRYEMLQMARDVNDEFEVIVGDVNDVFGALSHTPPVPAQAMDLSPDALLENLAPLPRDFVALERLVLKGLESGQGIFEFVSRRQQFAPHASKEKTIIATLRDHPEFTNGNLRLGNRYQVDSVASINESGASEDEDHLHAQMTVRDTLTNAQKVVPLTQIGLKFTDKILRSTQIERADALFERHLDHIADPDRRGELPVMVSAGGTGRTLLLSAYRHIRQAIRDNVVRDIAELDATLALFAEISVQVRGKKYEFSAEQIAEMKTPLLRELEPRQAARQAAIRKQQQDLLDEETSPIKREMFQQKTYLELVLLRGIDADLVSTETERIFPAGMVI